MLTPQGLPDGDAYVAGTRIKTALGRTGTLTGAVDLHRFPYVQFDSGALYAVRPEAIEGTITRFGAVHRFGDTREAYDASQCNDDIQDGDVLWVPEQGIAAVLYQAWPVAVNEPADVQYGEFHGFAGGPGALAAKDGGRYAESVQRARNLIAASPAEVTGGDDGYADFIVDQADVVRAGPDHPSAAPGTEILPARGHPDEQVPDPGDGDAAAAGEAGEAAAASAQAGAPLPGDHAAPAAPASGPADVPAVTAAIRDINDRLGYPGSLREPCPGHMTRDYRPVDGITVTGDPYAGDRTQRLHIAGVGVGIVQTPDFTGSAATCLLPHQPGGDLRLFGCASPGSALNGLQLHVLTEHGSPGKPPPPTALSLREFPAARPLAGYNPGASQLRRAARSPGTRAQPAPRPPGPGRSA